MYINGSKKKRKKRTCKERIKLVLHMLFDTLIVSHRHGKTGGLGWVNWVAGQTGHGSF